LAAFARLPTRASRRHLLFLYLKALLEEVTGVALEEELLPELPIKVSITTLRRHWRAWVT